MLVLCGDLTDYGLPEEAEVLVRGTGRRRQAADLAVLGNHDFESGQQDTVRQILADAGVTMLDGESCEVKGVGFAGAKGFGGGFGRGTLGAWGEPAVKVFVQEAIDEAMKLESALARLRTEHKIAVLHYAPIRATVENEPPEIFPYPRLQPPGGAAAPLPGDGRRPRPRPQRNVPREDADRRSRLQRLGPAPPQDVPGPAAVLGD